MRWSIYCALLAWKKQNSIPVPKRSQMSKYFDLKYWPIGDWTEQSILPVCPWFDSQCAHIFLYRDLTVSTRSKLPTVA